jgi:hypothetical protein
MNNFSFAYNVSKKSFRANAGILLVEATTAHAPAAINPDTSAGSPHKSSTLTQEHDKTTTIQRERSNAAKSRAAKTPSASCIPASTAAASEPDSAPAPPTARPEK